MYTALAMPSLCLHFMLHVLFMPASHSGNKPFCRCSFYAPLVEAVLNNKSHRRRYRFDCPMKPEPNSKSLSNNFIDSPEFLPNLWLSHWGSPSASDPGVKNTGQRATKGTVLTSQSLSLWCDCRRLGSTLASWRWQDINVGNPLWRRALLHSDRQHIVTYSH